jgi:hypothetical protein
MKKEISFLIKKEREKKRVLRGQKGLPKCPAS